MDGLELLPQNHDLEHNIKAEDSDDAVLMASQNLTDHIGQNSPGYAQVGVDGEATPTASSTVPKNIDQDPQPNVRRALSHSFSSFLSTAVHGPRRERL